MSVFTLQSLTPCIDSTLRAPHARFRGHTTYTILCRAPFTNPMDQFQTFDHFQSPLFGKLIRPIRFVEEYKTYVTEGNFIFQYFNFISFIFWGTNEEVLISISKRWQIQLNCPVICIVLNIKASVLKKIASFLSVICFRSINTLRTSSLSRY